MKILITNLTGYQQQAKYDIKNHRSRELELAFSDKKDIYDKLQQAYAEKSEINAKLKQAYEDKTERGERIKELEAELAAIRGSVGYKLMKGVRLVPGNAKKHDE